MIVKEGRANMQRGTEAVGGKLALIDRWLPGKPCSTPPASWRAGVGSSVSLDPPELASVDRWIRGQSSGSRTVMPSKRLKPRSRV